MLILILVILLIPVFMNIQLTGSLLCSLAVLCLVMQRSSPHREQLLPFELHSFPLSDQSQLGFHILKPFMAKQISQSVSIYLPLAFVFTVSKFKFTV